MKKIINIGIVAHVDAGKTTITENLLYYSGAIKSVGRVDLGNTQTDSMELERKRGITIKSSTISFTWNDVKVNIVDTPGHVDFISEVERSLSVLDGAIIVISGVEGIQSQTRILTDRNCHFGFFAVSGQNSVFPRTTTVFAPRTTNPIRIFRQRRLQEV